MNKIIVRNTIDDTFLENWQQLWEKSYDGNFFNTPNWFLASNTVYKVNTFRIITIEKNSELVLVLPLVRKSVFGIPVWTSLGGKFVNKSPLLLKDIDENLLHEFINFLIKQGDFYLPELTDEIADILCESNIHIIKKEASINPYLFIHPDPFCFLSSKNRSQIRGILKRNERYLTFKTFVGDEQALEAAFELDARSSKKQQGKATFVTQKDKQFFRELLHRSPRSFFIDFVYYQNKAIIYSIGFHYKNIFHAANTGFDAEYRFLRPGKLIANYLITKLQQDQLDCLDFGRGNSSLKQEFTKLTKAQYNLFYIRSPISKRWLLSTQRVYDGILHSKRLYTSYLFFKRYILYFAR